MKSTWTSPRHEYVEPAEINGAYRIDPRDSVYEVANVMNASRGRSRARVLVDSTNGGVYKESNAAKLFDAPYAGLPGDSSSDIGSRVVATWSVDSRSEG